MAGLNRILHVVASVEVESSGVTVCVRRLAEELGRQSRDVRVYSVGTEGAGRGRGYRDERFPQDWSAVPLLRSLRASRGLSKRLSDAVEPSDVVHGHGLWLMPNVYCGRAVERVPGARLVISPHGMLCPAALRFSRTKKRIFWRLFQERAIAAASCLHATCEQEFEDIRALGIGAPVAVVPNGIDVPDWQERAGAGATGRRRLLSLGRLHPKKGLDRLVTAWARLEPDFPDWDLVIAGPDEGGHAASIRRLVEALGLRRVDLVGPVYGEARDSLLRSADLFVLPTLSENFAMTVAESLAVGTPVITTHGAPWPGLVGNRCGWWIEHGVEPLAATLRQAMAHPRNVLCEMGRRGRDWVERDFSWTTVACRLAEIYDWVSGRRGRPETVRID